MKNLFYLSLLIFFVACGNQKTEPVSAPATAPDMEGFTVQDFGNGIQKATKIGEAGVVVEEGQLVNNLKSGTWTTYFPKDTRVKTIANYINGKKNGIFLELNDRGSVNIQANYVNDILDGKWVKYKFGSRAEKEINYKMGQLDGKYKEYHSNGKLQKEISYKNGKQHGSFRQYNDKEQVVMEYEYQNGEKISGGIVTPPSE
ncbi:MAG: toxin-antitoxin system YwqK family antitoxin [Saprospiraceae bacterium]